MALSGMQLMLKSMGVDMGEVNQALQVIPTAVNKILTTLQNIEAKQDAMLALLQSKAGVNEDARNDSNNRLN